ncbi:hypothetical protein [Siccirubricoccus phaeus]|uniref:hypothetical protein n=1 Tax=Siccirubricoccus phaeus TaxID=2595053 RepID=UPI0011F33589|nr:hypothetical protein [Siccirubricoccus phaeus]
MLALGIIIEASVRFVGLGAQPPTPACGDMPADARTYLLSGIALWSVVRPRDARFRPVRPQAIALRRVIDRGRRAGYGGGDQPRRQKVPEDGRMAPRRRRG